MFIPGETIAHQFIIPFVANEIEKVIVSYKQDDHIVLELTVTSEQIEQGETAAEAKFTVSLSQTQSLLFMNNKDTYAQLNVILPNGTRCSSKEMKLDTGNQHIREVIEDG